MKTSWCIFDLKHLLLDKFLFNTVIPVECYLENIQDWSCWTLAQIVIHTCPDTKSFQLHDGYRGFWKNSFPIEKKVREYLTPLRLDCRSSFIICGTPTLTLIHYEIKRGEGKINKIYLNIENIISNFLT